MEKFVVAVCNRPGDLFIVLSCELHDTRLPSVRVSYVLGRVCRTWIEFADITLGCGLISSLLRHPSVGGIGAAGVV